MPKLTKRVFDDRSVTLYLQTLSEQTKDVNITFQMTRQVLNKNQTCD